MKLDQILIKLKVFDADGTLSLTSVALMVVIVKIAIAKEIDIVSLGGLLVALLSYNAKKFSAHKKAEAEHKHELAKGVESDKIEVLSKEIRDLSNKFNQQQLFKR